MADWDGTFDDSEATDANGRPPPGCYRVEVIEAKLKQSTGGNGMVSLKLALDGRDWNVYDNVMLTGRGAGIGKAKAKGFGVLLEKGKKVVASDFEGRRATAYLKESEYDGKTRLAVDIEEGEHCGYDELTFEEDGSLPF